MEEFKFLNPWFKSEGGAAEGGWFKVTLAVIILLCCSVAVKRELGVKAGTVLVSPYSSPTVTGSGP